MHLEKEILKGKHFKKGELKKEAKEELHEGKEMKHEISSLKHKIAKKMSKPSAMDKAKHMGRLLKTMKGSNWHE